MLSIYDVNQKIEKNKNYNYKLHYIFIILEEQNICLSKNIFRIVVIKVPKIKTESSLWVY